MLVKVVSAAKVAGKTDVCTRITKTCNIMCVILLYIQ